MHYVLVVQVVSPFTRDRFSMASEDRSDLEPTYKDRKGVIFERYSEGDDKDEFIEYPLEYVFSRRIMKVDEDHEKKISSEVPEAGTFAHAIISSGDHRE